MAKKTPSNPYGLTIKERKWLKIYLESGNATKAAREAYGCTTDSSASTQGSMLLRKLDIPMNDLLDDMGLSDGCLALLLKEGLAATKIVTKRVDGKGTTTDDEPDHAIRKFYLELTYKVKGKLVNLVQHQDGQGNVIGPVILPAIPQPAQAPAEPTQGPAGQVAPGVPQPGDEAAA